MGSGLGAAGIPRSLDVSTKATLKRFATRKARVVRLVGHDGVATHSRDFPLHNAVRQEAPSQVRRNA